ncbi:MAG: serine hydrolase [Sphingomonas sp.]|nr:MAG: serine hydrolase [Sphingomonas sp.]
MRVSKMAVAAAALLTVSVAAPPLSSPAFAQKASSKAAIPSAALLEAQFAFLAKQTDGIVGVAVQKVGSSEIMTLNKGVTFPMASTFKVAVAARIFEKIDKGELTLDQIIPVDPKILVGSYGLAVMTPHDGISLSVHNLLELMITISDNTSTDVLVQLAGGPAAVTDWLTRHGIKGQRIDADTAHLIYRALDITPGPGTFKQNVEAAFKADPGKRERDQKRIPNAPFNADPRDTSTPEAMVQLLLLIESGKALSADSTKELLAIMGRCTTGEKRLKGLLPIGTVVAHKTGTLMSVANDVGFITLPDGSRFAIAVFVKGDTKGTETQDRVIAEMARTAYDYYVLGGR